mgnify:CR=1 FL=1
MEYIYQRNYSYDQGSLLHHFVLSPCQQNYPSLFEEEESEQAELKKETISYERKKSSKNHPGRNVLPDHLPVEEVIIENNTAVGVRMKDGKEFRAKNIVSNAGIFTTYNSFPPWWVGFIRKACVCQTVTRHGIKWCKDIACTRGLLACGVRLAVLAELPCLQTSMDARARG